MNLDLGLPASITVRMISVVEAASLWDLGTTILAN